MTQTAAQTSQFGDLDPEVLRSYGHEVVDWIVDYLANPQDHDVLPKTTPGEVSAQLPSSPPRGAR